MPLPEDVEAAVRAAARKHALENAVKHGSATAGAVIGKVMGAIPEARPHAKDVPGVVAAVVADVNAMTPDAREAAFADVADELAAGKRKDDAPKGPLKPLPNAEHGKVVLRMAPNPSGPPHFGHGRGFVINWTYREMYGGKLILRFDDTDTTVKPPWPPAYEMFPETMAWLAGRPDKVILASANMERYYEVAEDLARRGGAYVCECVGDEFREFKNRGEACPHRDRSPDENVDKWRRMVAGEYRRGAAVLRIKTDIQHKDPALRDWVAVRLAEEPHPLVGDRYKAWPLLDFQSAVDDHDEGVTHIIRGKDLRDSTAKQQFLYAHMGWTYPETLYWGRVSVHEFGKFSKSLLTEAIARGEYAGWDDPRLPTFPALRRRGIQAEAIRNFWLSFGITEKDIAASVVTLEAENRKIVEPRANRYFFVADPAEIIVTGVDHLVGRAPLHPDHPERGERVYHVRECPHGHPVLVARADLDETGLARAGTKVRLKDLANVEAQDPGAAEYAEHAPDAVGRYLGNDLDFLKDRSVRIIHWVPPDGVDATLLMPDGTTLVGKAEPHLMKEPVGEVVQLERVGFARVDAKDEHSVTLVFAHK